ncbi:hypothetical protein N0V93_005723 [Gnomoniopsis smithogilvyi]|uniref:Uncharacterized protein n=1 Tax=Gnomoniopsis smithogilvyi TaxID=1191159 RepID=A0A9W8YV11_9PEZI|nr:hypothetical protein N0V93_005723 [Gnomoniopsis smithogilvyi]
MAFQQRPFDARLSHQVFQQQSPRLSSQSAGHLAQQRPYSDSGSPQTQRSYPSFQNPGRVPQSHDDIIPNEFGRFIEVSDLTAETFTEDKYYQYLSTPIMIRFEKAEPRSKYDAAGEKVSSTWLNCTRTRLPNVDTAQADEEIQRLNRRDSKKGLTLMKKQQSLGPNAQMQLTKAERDLSAAVQDGRFNIILKQLDWTERSVVKRHVTGSKRHPNKRPRKERTSITAYFSRCPRPNQVSSTLYRQLEMERLQAQAQADQQRQEQDVTALRAREAQDQDERKHEEKMAEHRVRQEEAIANRMHEQRMMFQQQQQSHQMSQHQTGPGPQGYPQGQPTTISQQAGPLPQGHIQSHPHLGQQPEPRPQQHPHFQPHNKDQRGRPQMPINFQGMPLPRFRQMAPQQGPPQNFRQVPPQGDFFRKPTKSNRPIITVVTEHEGKPRHRRGQSQHSVSSSDSSSGSHSVLDSDSEPSSTSTKRTSLTSDTSGSPHMTRALPRRSRKPEGVAGSQYIADPVDDFVRDRRRPITRRHGKAYIQTGSERKIEVPGLTSPGPINDPLTQVREAYLAGHADHERLVLEVNRSGASATKSQPARRLAQSDAFLEGDRLGSLPNKHTLRFRRLSRSGAQGSRQPLIFQDGDLPRMRRVSTSEVGRELDRERARNLGEEHSPGMEHGDMNLGLRYDDRELERDFVARMRLGDERPDYQSSRYDGPELNALRERQRQRQRDSFTRGEHKDISRGIGQDSRRQCSRSPERDSYIDLSPRISGGRHEEASGFGLRGRL